MYRKLPLKIAFFLGILNLFFFTSFSQCNNIYQKLWGLNNNVSINVASAALTPNNDILVCGTIGPSGFIVKYNQLQAVEWAKMYRIGSSSNFKKIISLANGGVAAAGSTFEAGKTPLCVSTFDASGNVVWTKRFLDISSVPNLTYLYPLLEGFAETPDGGFVLCGRKVYRRPDNNFNYRSFVFKTDAAGNVVWTREDTVGNDDESFGMVVAQGSIFIAGSSNIFTIGTRCGFLEKLDPLTGAIQFLKFYRIPGITSNWFRSLEKASGGLEIGAQSFPFAGIRWYYDLKVDYSGNETELKKIPDPAPSLNLFDQYYHPVPLPDGGTLLWKDWYYSSTDACLAKIYSDRSTTWAYQYTLPEKQTLYKVLANPDNTALLVGTSPDPAVPAGPNQIYLSRVKPDGTFQACAADNESFPIRDTIAYVVTDGTWQTTQLTFETPLDAAVNETNFQLFETMICSESNCVIDTIKITGDANICGAQATVNYKASILGNCTSPVSWSLVPPIGNITTINDSIIQVQFTTSGTAVLTANAITSCFNESTSINLNYMPSSIVLNLGKDTSFCKGDTIQLSTGNNFQHVLWNTNATTNSIPVFTPGTFYVSATNDSVCFFRDTIIIKENPLPVVTLGNYTTLCQPDPIMLNAGNNFTSYLWQDGSVLPTFQINTPGSYWVQVTDNNNCRASSDTVNIIKVSQKPTNFVAFADTSLCAGKSILLKLLNNYASYNWNNGAAATPAYLVTKPGLYKIQVTNNDGCLGNDSVDVNTKYCLKNIYVPNTFTPNNDTKNDFFKPGIFGELNFFEMSLYNIYGQMIYKTDKADKGWDGTFLNAPQGQGNYVWLIRYRFTGNTIIEQLSGNVLLIR